ncbi:MAG TPA: hypothetical protein VME42_07450 [Steroidobacteraceae bacterium]|nr:hypothetical protein [Steroidobacteraceae bacterium]
MIRDICHAIGKRSATQRNYSEADFMKTTLIGIAAIAALSLLGLPAHANCAYRGAGDQQPDIQLPAYLQHLEDHEGIVGTWLVNYGPIGQAFIQWHRDGTEWENITHPSIGGNICMGSWVATGPRTYSRNHFGWIFDSTTGLIAGYFNMTETDTLSKNGNSYSGTNVSIFYDMAGNVVPAPGAPSPAPSDGYPGTSSAVRIAP